jgi:hypothetical protein
MAMLRRNRLELKGHSSGRPGRSAGARLALVVLVLSGAVVAALATAACTIERETDEGPTPAVPSSQAAIAAARTAVATVGHARAAAALATVKLR